MDMLGEYVGERGLQFVRGRAMLPGLDVGIVLGPHDYFACVEVHEDASRYTRRFLRSLHEAFPGVHSDYKARSEPALGLYQPFKVGTDLGHLIVVHAHPFEAQTIFARGHESAHMACAVQSGILQHLLEESGFYCLPEFRDREEAADVGGFLALHRHGMKLDSPFYFSAKTHDTVRLAMCEAQRWYAGLRGRAEEFIRRCDASPAALQALEQFYNVTRKHRAVDEVADLYISLFERTGDMRYLDRMQEIL